jgi:hypothetical protein
MNDETKNTDVPHRVPSPQYTGLRNSLWCTDKDGRVGMIGEVGAGVAAFHYADKDGKLGAAVSVPLDQLKIAKASELPEHLGYTEEQLTEFGYL